MLRETLIWHVAPAVACAGFQVLIGWLTQGFIFSNIDGIRWIPIAVSVAPALLVYFFLRILLSAWLSATLVMSATLVAHAASMMKVSATEIPLSWSDITATENYSIIAHYLPKTVLVAAVLALVGILFAISRIGHQGSSAAARLIYALLGLSISALLFSSHYATMAPRLSTELTAWLQKNDVYYASWDWRRDAEQVGLPMHIIHTSARHFPAVPTDEQQAQYKKLLRQEDPALERANKVILILCESCWHDEQNFSDLFDPLRLVGFHELRAISPTFGGQTVNASFELLTGLPANGPLTGVIYQEYGQLFSQHVEALPARLKAIGYSTIAMHNHYRTFWMRDVVKPKLGFGKFIAREEMAEDDPSVPTENIFIDDSFLFTAAQKELRSQRHSKLFMFLTTAHTHGPFVKQGDDGEMDYRDRLKRTIEQVASFSSEVLAEDPNAVLVVVGDHKPGMTDYLKEHGALSREPLDQSVFGDMPVYIASREPALTLQIEQQADGEPFFCLSAALNDVLFHVHVPAHDYARSRGICNGFNVSGYAATVMKFEEWLYYFSLFHTALSQPVN